MPKYCPENERVKRDYAFFLQAASGKQDATIDAALRAIERFETSTSRRPFGKFHVEQARSFRASLVEQSGRNGHPLSVATITTTLKHLRHFFLWLSREPGFRSKLQRRYGTSIGAIDRQAAWPLTLDGEPGNEPQWRL